MSRRPRLLRPVPLSVLSLLFAAAAAVGGFYQVVGLTLFCTGQPLQGENIDHGLAIAFFGGLAGAVGVVILRRHRRPVVGALLLSAAALSLAIAFVGLDSATYVQQKTSCGFESGFGIETGRLAYLYYAWGAALAVILVQLARVARAGPPEPP
jgi:hypothetical protein